MSGICGLFNFDGVQVTRAEIGGMAAILAEWGPDGTGLRIEGVAGFGHTLLTNTPEARYEKQPIVDDQSGCMITADLRLDNREDLLDALGLKHRRDEVGDAGLVLSAYQMWGENCVDRLIGDFAFAIFDRREQKIFCARDPFGLKPFNYFLDAKRFFAFASSPKSILTLPQVPYRLNAGRIADFLVPELEWIDYTSTFFEEVYRLPPGHELSITPERFEITEYWSPEPGPDPGELSDTEWRKGFMEHLTTAASARLRAPVRTIGSMLSGGMDSGSVACIAKDMLQASGRGPLPTVSATRRSYDSCAESRAIRATQQLPGLAAHAIYLEDLNGAARQLMSGIEEPFDGQAMLLKAVYRHAAAHDIHIILDGAGGDVVLSEGSYIARLLRRGRIDVALSEIVAQNRFWGGPGVLREVALYGRSAYALGFVKKGFRPIQINRRIASALQESLISPELAAHVDIRARFERMAQTFSNIQHRDYAVQSVKAIRPAVTAGRERYARLAASFGCEARDPYLDRRLVQFAAHLPERLRLRKGWPKMILRELMADRLPEDVRWMRGKPHLGWLFNAAVCQASYESGDLTLARLRSHLSDYIDETTLERAWQKFVNESDHESIHTANVLSVWLAENRNRPVVTIP